MSVPGFPSGAQHAYPIEMGRNWTSTFFWQSTRRHLGVDSPSFGRRVDQNVPPEQWPPPIERVLFLPLDRPNIRLTRRTESEAARATIDTLDAPTRKLLIRLVSVYFIFDLDTSGESLRSPSSYYSSSIPFSSSQLKKRWPTQLG